MATPAAPSTAAPKTAPKKSGQWKKVFTWLVALVVVGLIGYWTYSKLQPAPSSKMITSTITTGSLTESVSAQGSVQAQTGAEVHIGSQVSGQIKRLATDVGHVVKAGQLIAELNLPELHDELAEAQATLAQDETKYQQELSGVNQEVVTTAAAINVAQQAVASAGEKLKEARANARLEDVQAPSDIEKARSTLAAARATLVQTQVGADLTVRTAEETLAQAQANARNSSISLSRTRRLYREGFVAPADLDTAIAADGVNQALVRSGSENLALTKQKVEASLETSRDAVESARAALDAAHAEMETVISDHAAVKDAETTLKTAQANFATAEANRANDVLKQQDVLTAKQVVDQAKAAVAYSETQVAKSYITSPIAGTILSLAAQQGETVAAGLSTQVLVVVCDLDRLEIDAFVNETDIGKVKIGQIAQCTTDAFPGETFNGRVTKIASGSTIQQGVVTYDVTIGIEDPKHNLKPDMTSNVTIDVGQLSNVIVVPAVAIQIGSGGSTVNVLKMVNGKQTVVAVPVVTGGTDGVNIEVKSGLKPGDVVVLAGGTPSTVRAASSPFQTPARGGGH